MKPPNLNRTFEPDVQEFLADEGDTCDHCGVAMPADSLCYSDVRLRCRWYFCSVEHCHKGYTLEHSAKARFIGAVLDKR